MKTRALLSALAALCCAAFPIRGADATTYSYDTGNRLTKVTYPDGRQIAYSYDEMDNIVGVAALNASAPVVLGGGPLEGKIGLPIPDFAVTVNHPADVTAYSASGLPAGLKINGTTAVKDGKAPGTIYGTPAKSGTFTVTLATKSALGAGTPATLIVNIANPFTDLADEYDLMGNALAAVAASGIAGGSTGGSLSLSVAANGVFTGKLALGGKSYALKGALNAATGASGTIVIDRPAPLADLTLSVTLALGGANRGIVTGTLTDGTAAAAVNGFVSVWSAKNRAFAFGGVKGASYNIALVADAAHLGDDAYPQGTGYATVRIAPTGEVRLAGKLADGTAITGRSFLFANGEVTIFIPLYKGQGMLTGVLTASDGGSVDLLEDNTLAGTLTWHRPALAGNLYASGFPTPMTTHATGGFYAAPDKGFRVLELGGGPTHLAVNIELTEGALSPDIVSSLAIDTANRVAGFTPNSNSLVLKFSSKTGAFSGKFTVQSPARTASFQGLLLPMNDAMPAQGLGFFLLPGATPGAPILSGNVYIGPP